MSIPHNGNGDAKRQEIYVNLWTTKSSKTSVNLSGTYNSLPFTSFLTWLNEYRISSLLQKDQYDRLTVYRPYICSCSERGFTNVVGNPVKVVAVKVFVFLFFFLFFLFSTNNPPPFKQVQSRTHTFYQLICVVKSLLVPGTTPHRTTG